MAKSGPSIWPFFGGNSMLRNVLSRKPKAVTIARNRSKAIKRFAIVWFGGTFLIGYVWGLYLFWNIAG